MGTVLFVIKKSQREGLARRSQPSPVSSKRAKENRPLCQWLSDAGYELFYFQADGYAFVVMDIMAAIEAYCLGIHLTGELHAVINPAA